jgi:hypothetical protein
VNRGLGTRLHRRDGAEAGFAAVHLCVGFGHVAEWELLDHRVHAALGAEFQGVLGISRGSGIPTGHGTRAHDQREGADGQRFERGGRDQEVSVHRQSLHQSRNGLCVWRRREDRARLRAFAISAAGSSALALGCIASSLKPELCESVI